MTITGAHSIGVWAGQLEDTLRLRKALEHASPNKPVQMTVNDGNDGQVQLTINGSSFLSSALINATRTAEGTYKDIIKREVE